MSTEPHQHNKQPSNGCLRFSCSALLESRHETFLQWCEPWPACGPEGNDIVAHIVLQATVHDCINMQRRVAKAAGRPTMGDDENHMLDFIAIHWARVVEPSDKLCHADGDGGAQKGQSK